MTMLKVRVYYANQLVVIWHLNPREVLKFDRLETEIYNGGYIKYPEGHQLYSSGWARCDGTPVLLEDVPKELRLIELLNST